MSVEMSEFEENRINIIPDDPATPEDEIPGGEPVTGSEVSDAEQDDAIASIEKIAAEFSAEDVPEEADAEVISAESESAWPDDPAAEGADAVPEAESEEHTDAVDSESGPEDSEAGTEEAPEEMDMEEAALVARTLAKAMVVAEQRAAQKHVYTEEELLANEAAEQAAKKTVKGRASAGLKRFFSVATPDNKKYAIPAFILEVLVLAALVIALGRFSHTAPRTPTQYAEPEGADAVACEEGLLIVNDVHVKVPKTDNVSYNISYSWAEDDKDYPSVPHGIVASYKEIPAETSADEKQEAPAAEDKASDKKDAGEKASDEKSSEEKASAEEKSSDENASAEQGSEEKASEKEASDQKNSGEQASDEISGDESSSEEQTSDEKASDDKDSEEKTDEKSDSDKKDSKDKEPAKSEEAEGSAGEQPASGDGEAVAAPRTLYDIALYKDSFIPKRDIPKGKNYKNWFSDWKTEKSGGVYKFPHKVGDIRGFCISTLDSETAEEDYRTYTYYFTVPGNNGISVYVIEGTCYDPESRAKFKKIIQKSINTMTLNRHAA